VTSFHRVSYAPVREALEDKKPKVLLHVCCGPDATVPIMDLKKDYEVIGYWYDPNIQPKAEYDKRRDAFARVCEIE
jgi:predicted adenine nucleotide alpha hydrolase (AANH) superfamily ATPase